MATILFSVLAQSRANRLRNHDRRRLSRREGSDGGCGWVTEHELHAGDQGTVVGDGIADVWARLGRFKVVSEIYSPDAGTRQFWSESRERRTVAHES